MHASSVEFSARSAAGNERVSFRSFALHGIIFCVAFIVLFSRRPDAILHSQFYAEDGKYWYADAYNLGWRCLLLPLGGYLNSLSRLIGLFALLFPLAAAPLVMNLCAMVFQILPIHIFLSNRFQCIRWDLRVFSSALYLALPNSYELHANTTNIQWHLALAGCMLLLSSTASGSSWRARVFDVAVLSFVSIDGPLAILLIPTAATLWWKYRDARSKLLLWALIPGSVLQLLIMVLLHSRRSAPNSETLSGLIGILGLQVFFSSLFGLKTALDLMLVDDRLLYFIEIIAAIGGISVLLYALCKAPLRLKLFVCFAITVLTVALIRPLATTDGIRAQWVMLQNPGIGNRYYFFPMLAFLASLIWIAGRSSSVMLRHGALAALLLLPIGISRDWGYPPFIDLNFRRFVAEFEQAAPGMKVQIPINPDWQMQLTKR